MEASCGLSARKPEDLAVVYEEHLDSSHLALNNTMVTSLKTFYTTDRYKQLYW